MDRRHFARNTSDRKSPEQESAVKPSPLQSSQTNYHKGFCNGVLKKNRLSPVYRECLKNHAAAMGGHVLDGCCEFMPESNAISLHPAYIKCGVCGCHRNFHRKEFDDDPNQLEVPSFPQNANSPPFPSSSPKVSSFFPASAPQMLLALSKAGPFPGSPTNSGIRKRFRTRFTPEQKEKMLGFAEKLGWKMQKRDEGLIKDFCSEIGVEKGVVKVWMHNNKHTFVKRDVDFNDDGNRAVTSAGINCTNDNIVRSESHPSLNGSSSSS